MARMLLVFARFSLAAAGITWQMAESEESTTRRLAIQLASSVTNTTDPKCIVGGFDDADPNTVYVGGPCSELDVTMDGDKVKDAKPKAGGKFRYVAMKVLKGGIASAGGEEVKMSYVDGSAFMHHGEAADKSYAFVGTGASIYVPDTYAAMVVSQTSYLSRAAFNFKENKFAYWKDKAADKVYEMAACVTPCCTGHGCECAKPEKVGACSGPKIPVTVGQYKFSIFAASGDMDTVKGYQDGAGGNGWQMLKEKHGKSIDGKKTLNGNLFIDQAIDFTGLGADTLTIKGTGDKSTMYKDMKAYAMAKDESDVYEVKSITVESDSWKAGYTFPTAYVGGPWKTGTDKSLSTEQHGAGVVKIYAMKLPDSDLVAMGMTTGSKVVFLRYVFDVTGIQAGKGWGVWYAYDPTVQTIPQGGAATISVAPQGGAATTSVAPKGSASVALKGATVNTLLTMLLIMALAGGIATDAVP